MIYKYCFRCAENNSHNGAFGASSDFVPKFIHDAMKEGNQKQGYDNTVSENKMEAQPGAPSNEKVEG